MCTIVVSSIGICHRNATSLEDALNNFNTSSDSQNSYIIENDVIDRELSKSIDLEEVRRVDRISRISLSSALSCKRALKLNLQEHINDIGIINNTNFGAISSSENFINGALTRGDKNASPIVFPFSVPNAATGMVTLHLGLRGFNNTLSGFNPVGYAFDLLKLDRANGFFVGGADELSDQVSSVKLENNLFYNKKKSEGSGTVFMTTLPFATKNKLDVLFEISSFSNFCSICDPYSIDNSDNINEDSLIEHFENIFSNKGSKPADIDVIVSSFQPESEWQQMEQRVLSRFYKNQKPHIVYPKSILGETYGAASTMSLIYAYCFLESTQLLKTALVSNFEIGGNFSSLIIKINK
jgi:3-oxoacyl-(acyl-carrier-protein) synthase